MSMHALSQDLRHNGQEFYAEAQKAHRVKVDQGLKAIQAGGDGIPGLDSKANALHFYKTAETAQGEEFEKIAPWQYFAQYARHHGVAPDDRELKAREDHYLSTWGVQEWEVNRSQAVKAWARDSWSVERYMIDHGVIPTNQSAEPASTVRKAFNVTPVLAVFPIFYDTQIVAGILATPLLNRLVSQTVMVNSGTADHVVMNETVADRITGEIGEFTRFPELTISATNAPIKLKKWGGILRASDEAVRRARLPVFAAGLQRIGRQLAIDLTDFAIDVLMLGDGNAGAVTGVVAAVPGSPTYSDIVGTMLNFPIGYNPTDAIAPGVTIAKLLNFSEFKDPLSGFRFQATAQFPTPVGLMLHRWDSTGSTGWATNSATVIPQMLFIQNDRCLVQYQEGGLTSESDRIINGEWSELKTSLYCGFAILDTNARRKLTSM